MTDPSTTVFIGAGAVATALARRMADRGYPIAGILSRTKASADALARVVGAPLASSRFEDLPADSRWILLCVPDDSLPEVVAQLEALDHPWAECLVAHTAGVLSSGVLHPLSEKGAATISMHPVQTFTSTSSPDVVEGVAFTLEGNEQAVAAMTTIVRDLGAHPLRIDPEHRTQIHLAASMASNFFVTLIAAAVDVLQHTRLSEDEALALLRPLVRSTWQNLEQNVPQNALTGPIQRGDQITIKRHLEALSDERPALGSLYKTLARETAHLAVRSGRLTSEEATLVLSVLDESL